MYLNSSDEAVRQRAKVEAAWEVLDARFDQAVARIRTEIPFPILETTRPVTLRAQWQQYSDTVEFHQQGRKSFNVHLQIGYNGSAYFQNWRILEDAEPGPLEVMTADWFYEQIVAELATAPIRPEPQPV